MSLSAPSPAVARPRRRGPSTFPARFGLDSQSPRTSPIVVTDPPATAGQSQSLGFSGDDGCPNDGCTSVSPQSTPTPVTDPPS